jgi:hypothetical protein
MSKSKFTRWHFALLAPLSVTLALACGDSSDDSAVPSNASPDSGTQVSPQPTDGGRIDFNFDAMADAMTGPLSVTPATANAVVSGAPIVLTATATDATTTVNWTLTGPGSLSLRSGPTTTYTPPENGPIGLATVTATAGALTATSSITVSQPAKRSVVAYAWADQSSMANYTPAAAYSYNASGGAISAGRTAAGTYTMTFEGLSLIAGDVQVSTFGSSERCSVTSWSGTTVNVSCVNASGVATDARYMLAVTLPNTYSGANVVAYAWANDESDSGYTPNPTYSYNAAGGIITAQRFGSGRYAMTFGGQSLANGTALVSAQGSDRHCTVHTLGSASASTVGVRCYDAAGNLADSRYTVYIVRNSRYSEASSAAYVWANDPSAANYVPSASYSYNAGSGAITATRTAAGTYSVAFAGLSLAGANVKVSAFNSQRVCNPQAWTGSTVEVRCFDATGTLADSQYTATVILPNQPVSMRIAAYAWADQPSEESYTAPPNYSYNAAGGLIAVNRYDVGEYSVFFQDLQLDNGNIQVTPYDTNAICSVVSWSENSVNVNCYNTAGQPVDSRYIVTVYLNNVFSSANTVGYAWANDATSATYLPTGPHAYNAGGGAITATRTTTGTYIMSFAGLSLSTGVVQVNAVGSNASCAAVTWAGSSVSIRCYDAAGALVDSQYVVSVLQRFVPSLAVPMAFAWTNSATLPSYTPSSGYSYSASNGTITATRTEAGTYSIRLAGLNLDGGTVKVSAFGSTARCNVASWSGDTVSVRCYGTSGALTDSRYTIAYTR